MGGRNLDLPIIGCRAFGPSLSNRLPSVVMIEQCLQPLPPHPWSMCVCSSHTIQTVRHQELPASQGHCEGAGGIPKNVREEEFQHLTPPRALAPHEAAPARMHVSVPFGGRLSVPRCCREEGQVGALEPRELEGRGPVPWKPRQGVDTKVTCGEWGLRGQGVPSWPHILSPESLVRQLTHPASAFAMGRTHLPATRAL